jgi:3D (Asp-Asp-Asp) domain-containing protein
VVKGFGVAGFFALVAWSAVAAKHQAVRGDGGGMTALAAVEGVSSEKDAPAPSAEDFIRDPLAVDGEDVLIAPAPKAGAGEPSLETRWFDGRPVRPARTIWMTVTAYSPDARSCPGTDDGITSSLHDVRTNNMKLVAADTRLLPLGSMVSVPGYDAGRIVPVLDRGGAIKGKRLDVLFATHEEARKFGVRRVAVTVWEYADGKGKDWRKVRDSK